MAERRVDSIEQFAVNLRRFRRAADLSQEELGDAAELHRTEISRLECATRDPRLSTIARLAEALDISISDLMQGVR